MLRSTYGRLPPKQAPMSSIATRSLLGQSPDVVQGVLGPYHHHQPNPDNQTDLYVYGTSYLRGVFPVQTTGLIGIYRNHLCIALKVVFSKVDPRYSHFVYNREIASRLFERVMGNDYAHWQPVEADPRANDTVHYVYCMGHRVATTWDAKATNQTLASDVSIFLDNRCEPDTNTLLAQPLIPQVTGGQAFIRRQPGAAKVAPEAVKPTEPEGFSDLESNPYAPEILKATHTYHIVTGTGGGRFQPEAAVTRAQGLTWLINTLGQMAAHPEAIALPETVTNTPFADVPAAHPQAPQFALAQQLELIFADDDGQVYPDATMTRAEWVAMVHNGLQGLVELNYGPTTALEDVIEPRSAGITFTDLSGHWGESVIRSMAVYGLASPLDDSSTHFGPEAPAQRDYATALLVRLIEVPRAAVPGAKPRPGAIKVFSDIGQDVYKDEIIQAVNQYGLITGYDDQTFRPSEPVSREQAVAMVVKAMQTLVSDPDAIQIPDTLSDPPPFADVTAGENATKIQFAKIAGLVSDDDDGYFRPLDKLSRAQLMAMVYRALEFVVQANLGQSVPLITAIIPTKPPQAAFHDVPDDHWAREMISTLARVGLASPYSETGTAFKPDQPAQRNMATAAMVRLVETRLTQLEAPPPTQPVPFNDIQGNPYAEAILQAAHTYNLVKGYEDGTFKPTSPMTREQAVSLVVEALTHKVKKTAAITIPDHLTQAPFADVDINRWSAPQLYFAKQAGIVVGDDLGRFQPEAPLSRAQLAAMMHQALRYAIRVDFDKTTVPLDQVLTVDPNQVRTFTDLPDDHWATPMVNALATVGLALPKDANTPDQFGPNTLAYRDYAVAAIVGMLGMSYR
ncbi:MAG: S-layer homology domain-containing protein [Leptolyngbya sp. LCM1.Bin17]|nr:MAG: S-layer homology domain-containing protein [Leptolyngbya sp. LCM1.Bin17]